MARAAIRIIARVIVILPFVQQMSAGNCTGSAPVDAIFPDAGQRQYHTCLFGSHRLARRRPRRLGVVSDWYRSDYHQELGGLRRSYPELL